MRRQVENLQSFEWPWLNKSTMLVKKACSSLKLCGIVRPTAQPANRQPIGPSRKTQALFSQPATCLFVQRLTIFGDLSFCLALGHPAYHLGKGSNQETRNRNWMAVSSSMPHHWCAKWDDNEDKRTTEAEWEGGQWGGPIKTEIETERNLFLPKYSAEYVTEYSAETE